MDRRDQRTGCTPASIAVLLLSLPAAGVLRLSGLETLAIFVLTPAWLMFAALFIGDWLGLLHLAAGAMRASGPPDAAASRRRPEIRVPAPGTRTVTRDQPAGGTENHRGGPPHRMAWIGFVAASLLLLLLTIVLLLWPRWDSTAMAVAAGMVTVVVGMLVWVGWAAGQTRPARNPNGRNAAGPGGTSRLPQESAASRSLAAGDVATKAPEGSAPDGGETPPLAERSPAEETTRTGTAAGRTVENPSEGGSAGFRQRLRTVGWVAWVAVAATALLVGAAVLGFLGLRTAGSIVGVPLLFLLPALGIGIGVRVSGLSLLGGRATDG